MKSVPFESLKGKTLLEVRNLEDEIVFDTECGETYKMYHDQGCCEQVDIEDICGHLEDLVGSPILVAEERTNDDTHPKNDSGTWTFYELATIKGSVTIRWYGSSNGNYSEGVSFYKVD